MVRDRACGLLRARRIEMAQFAGDRTASLTRMSHEKTFAEIVEEARSSSEREVAPSTRDVRFRDPSGNPLLKVGKVEPAQARKLVRDGALLAFEDCGCGGGAPGCSARWIDQETRQSLASQSSPRLAGGKRSVSWLDLWESDASFVVYAHGDVKWGHALA